MPRQTQSVQPSYEKWSGLNVIHLNNQIYQRALEKAEPIYLIFPDKQYAEAIEFRRGEKFKELQVRVIGFNRFISLDQTFQLIHNGKPIIK